ncbi:hypothetical protein [Burkholderia multivorans]|uniref:hypothetical protein n=1 Tax=Burkholderia multivorans TaxID=87883 RepID=UPI00143E82D0|nr:hypothetical protein [Burkholderia multivorans]QIX17333.1 hypothetical protein FOB32_17195 [Burkholderia multivorans]
MNVRVHKRDFTWEDFSDVDSVAESWGGDELVIRDSNQDELARIDAGEIASVEIRV